ncbi:MAG TPA: hypothetical protein VLD18_13120, partial [Verrucomicrobiae bacterium]|nr:hypothetical protein [Verrucomicrobiae bacterium]
SLGTTFSTSDAAAVNGYLAGGGSLLMSSMELLSRLEEGGLPTFAREVFGVQSFTADTGVPAVVGAGGEPIGAGIDAVLDYSAYEDFVKELVGIPADASDVMVATTNGSPVLVDGLQAVGVRSPRTGQDRPGRTVFLSFPLDAMPLGTGVGNNRAGLLKNILAFLAPQEGSSTIRLDRDVYTVPGFATVEVEDLDQSGRAAIAVQCFSPDQPGSVIVNLSETPRRGLFRGTISPVPVGQGSGEDQLRVASGSSFRVEYQDTSAGRSVEVSAVVETELPDISNVVVEPGYVDAVVTWQTSEPTDALVQYSESPDSFPINYTAYDGAFDFDHALVLEHLKPE